MSYEIEVKIILKGIEPFTIVIGLVENFLKFLIKSNLMKGYTLEVKE